MEKPKMRIKLLNPDLTCLSDRLVIQDIELAQGPKDKHKGPILIEATFRDKEDISKFKAYIDGLTDDLPLPDKKKYKKTAAFDGEPIKELLEEVTVKCKTIEEKIKYLRERGFEFVNTQWIKDKELPIKIKELHEPYQWLIRKIKAAKNPVNDKYDPQLIIGIKVVGKTKGEKIHIYLYNEHLRTEKAIWGKDSSINFKKLLATKFPHYMTADEREKYRMETAKLKADKELKPSKFYLRWKPAVEAENKTS